MWKILGKLNSKKFSCSATEVAFARAFFTEKISELDPKDFPVRESFELIPHKQITDFLDYCFENGHRGVFPFETNGAGVLRKRAGRF